MGKAARRSVASDPSSPLDEYSPTAQTTKQKADPSFYTTSTTYVRKPIKLSAVSYRPPKYGNKSQGTTPYLSPTVEGQFYDDYINETAVAIARERERMEFFATYDVMTGVRIAATLGAFFGLMVFLIVYKSRSTSNKALQKCLEDPKIAAVAAAVMQEEEDRELQEAFEATAFSLCKDDLDFPIEDHEMIRERMLSLGNVSAPPILHRGFRFSSISGYSSLIEPHRRYSYNERLRRQSTSESQSSRILSAYRMGDSFGTDDYFIESDGEEADDEFEQFTTTAEIANPINLLAVPIKGGESRRSSGITCCSTESSFLERRCSAITLGLTSLTSISQNPSRRQSQDISVWDANTLHHPQPGIHVTEPTPKPSPCSSERQHPFNYSNNNQKSHQYDNSNVSVTEYNYDNSKSEKYLISHSNLDNTATNVASSISASNCCKSEEKLLRRAPLASLSSFKMSSTDYQDSDLRSLGSDSVFAESYADTDDDMQQFSTDSDELSLTQSPPTTATTTNTLTHQQSFQMRKQQQFHRNSINCTSFVINIDDDADDGENCHQNSLAYNINDNKSKSNNEENNFNLMTGRNKTYNYSYDKNNSVVKQNVICGGCRPKTKSSNNAFKSIIEPTITTSKSLSERHQKHSTSNSITLSTRSTTRPASHSFAGCLPTTASSNIELNLEKPFIRDDENANHLIRKECVEVNVIVKTNSFSGSNISPSVILELPIITTTTVNDEEARSHEDSISHIDDPSIPGPSHRKWSKETLF